MRLHLLAFGVLLALLGTQLAWVKSSNFYGSDEWTVLYLLSRGIVDIPYANRPVEMIWALPTAWFGPWSFFSWTVLYGIYATLSGFLVYLICRRIEPGRPLLAVLAGCFAIAWAPTDYARLSADERILYGGITFGMLLATAVYLESWRRRHALLLGLSLALCLLAGRCYEGTLPVLFLAPLLLLFQDRRDTRALRVWVLAWEGVVAATLGLVLRSASMPADEASYQAWFGLDLDPRHVLQRIGLQYWEHLGPLVTTPPRQLLSAAVAIAVVVFLVAAIAWGRAAPPDPPRAARLWPLMLLGLALAGAGYGALVLTERGGHPWRMQFLSAPGIALLLAALVTLVAEFAGARHARASAAFLAAWLIAVGTARTVAMQRLLDVQSYYGPQTRLLTQLTTVAPDLKPHTLVVLLDGVGAWRSNFGFRHAVESLYDSRAIGYLFGSWDGMFPTTFLPAGVRCEPWPSVRGPWDVAPSLHRYDEIVVVRATPAEGVVVADAWPKELPPLPPGARYDPRPRIGALRAPVPARAALSPLDAR